MPLLLELRGAKEMYKINESRQRTLLLWLVVSARNVSAPVVPRRCHHLHHSSAVPKTRTETARVAPASTDPVLLFPYHTHNLRLWRAVLSRTHQAQGERLKPKHPGLLRGWETTCSRLGRPAPDPTRSKAGSLAHIIAVPGRAISHGQSHRPKDQHNGARPTWREAMLSDPCTSILVLYTQLRNYFFLQIAFLLSPTFFFFLLDPLSPYFGAVALFFSVALVF